MAAPRKRSGATFQAWQSKEYELNMQAKRGEVVWQDDRSDGWNTCRGEFVTAPALAA